MNTAPIIVAVRHAREDGWMRRDGAERTGSGDIPVAVRARAGRAFRSHRVRDARLVCRRLASKCAPPARCEDGDRNVAAPSVRAEKIRARGAFKDG